MEQVTEEAWNADVERINIARDLSAIEDAYLRLRVEAYHHHDDPDIPGGEPMVMLGPRADVEAWGYVQISAMMGRLDGSMTPKQGAFGERKRDIELKAIVALGVEPPLSFLAGWVDIIRAERGQQRTKAWATIGGEVDYLRNAIDWILATDDDGAPWWLPAEDFARQLEHVRKALDHALGLHEQRDTGAPCLTHGGAYVKRWGDAVDESDDRWWCERGKHAATEEDYRYANLQLRRQFADRLTSTDMEAEYRIEQSTLRTWAQRGCVPKRGKDDSGRLLYDVEAAKALRDGEHKHDGCGTDTRETRILREFMAT